jgi:hypothetical protein
VVGGFGVQREQDFAGDGVGGGEHGLTMGATAGTVKAESDQAKRMGGGRLGNRFD